MFDKKLKETALPTFPSLPDLHLIRVQRHKEGEPFLMGDATSKYDHERPVHPVSIRHSFYIGQFPVTQRLYQLIMNENPSHFKGERRPVERVSWEDARQFIAKLNKREEVEGLAGEFRLPTEAEWEYAARGGPYWEDGFSYCGSDELKQVGWCRENSGMETKPVGLLLPNQLGLYDMSGNVYEWCEDDWHDTYEAAPDDGSAWIDRPNRGASRVIRGGRYFGRPVYCRPALRYRNSPGDRPGPIGFRLVFSLQLQESHPDIP